LIRAPLSTTSVLDEAADVVRLAAPWSAVIVLTALPYRFLQAVFFDQLAETGSQASRYGNLLGGTANLIVAAILFAFWGRAVFARACRLAHARGTAPGREAWSVSRAAFASYVLTGSAAFFAGFLTFFTLIGIVVAVMFAGLAIGTMELNERISIVEPFRHITRSARSLAIPAALVFVFFCALVIAFVNLAAAFGLAVWLFTAVAGFDAPHWPALFGFGNRRFALMLLAGALVVVEPFWVAAHVIYVRKAGAQESGDDLRAWFEELRRAS